MSLAWNALLFRRLAANPLLRISIHPVDRRHAKVWQQIRELVTRALADRDPSFHPSRCPVVSCDLTECELPEIGFGLADGHMAAASYFDSLAGQGNLNFKSQVARKLGDDRRISSFFATSYATLCLFADAAARCGTDDPRGIRAALHAKRSALQGAENSLMSILTKASSEP